MEWHFRNDQPIYTQLTQQITLAILSGSIPSGGRLPTVRELAADAGVNPNTVQKAYRMLGNGDEAVNRALAELEGTGLLHTQRTAGRFVTEDTAVIQSAKEDLARSRTREYLESMAQLGYDRQQVKALLEEWKEE